MFGFEALELACQMMFRVNGESMAQWCTSTSSTARFGFSMMEPPGRSSMNCSQRVSQVRTSYWDFTPPKCGDTLDLLWDRAAHASIRGVRGRPSPSLAFLGAAQKVFEKLGFV